MKRVALLVLCILPTLSLPAHAAWLNDGSPVIVQSSEQFVIGIVSDGFGGTIVAWYDATTNPPTIYAQRMSSVGTPEWAVAGLPVCTHAFPKSNADVVSDNAHGAIVCWEDGRNGNVDVYAQRLYFNGTPAWVNNGVAVCTATGNQNHPQLVSLAAGEATLTWSDARNGAAQSDIYSQRVDAMGATVWAANGIPVCAAPAQQEGPHIVSDEAGGVVIAWQDYRDGNWLDNIGDIYAQRLSTSGNLLWGLDGVAVCTAVAGQYTPIPVPDGSGGAIIAWVDGRVDPAPWDIYAQRINRLGSPVWLADGVPVCTAVGLQHLMHVARDGSTGIIVGWTDYRDGTAHIYSQRMDINGAALWTADGVGVCLAPGGQSLGDVVSDGAGGAVLAWQDNRNPLPYDVYAQRLAPNGSDLWTPGGVEFCTDDAAQGAPVVTMDAGGCAVLAWDDHRNADTDVYAARYVGCVPVGVAEGPPPTALSVSAGIPNPFAATTTLNITLPAPSAIHVEVYDAAGHRVSVRDFPRAGAGHVVVSIDGHDSHGGLLPNGVYFARIEAGGSRVTRKLVLVH